MDLPEDVELEAGEVVLRRDLVLQNGPNSFVSHRGFNHVGRPNTAAWMTLTTRRVVVQPFTYPLWFDVVRAIFDYGLFRPIADYTIEISEIRRIWRWKPELSGPPFIQRRAEMLGVAYWLIEDRFPWSRKLPHQAQLEHVAALEEAWRISIDKQAEADANRLL